MEVMLRTFIAVSIQASPTLRQLLTELAQMGKALRPVSEANLHVTLRFLGATDPQSVPDIKAIMERAVASQHSLECRLYGVSAFPSQQRPQTIWAGVEDGERLHQLALNLAALDQLGFAPDSRPWNCHLTLARVKFRPPPVLRDWLHKYSGSMLGIWPVRQIELHQSELSPQGPRYRLLHAVPLAD